MISGPDTKYMMQWGGEWRPVTNMFDHMNMPTTMAMRAVKAVLYVSDDVWIAVAVSPGEIIERAERDPKLRQWEAL
jgi:hypothetical protein